MFQTIYLLSLQICLVRISSNMVIWFDHIYSNIFICALFFSICFYDNPFMYQTISLKFITFSIFRLFYNTHKITISRCFHPSFLTSALLINHVHFGYTFVFLEVQSYICIAWFILTIFILEIFDFEQQLITPSLKSILITVFFHHPIIIIYLALQLFFYMTLLTYPLFVIFCHIVYSQLFIQ